MRDNSLTKDAEAALVRIPSAIWLVLAFVPALAAAFIIAEFTWIIAVPPIIAAVLLFSTSAWAWHLRRVHRRHS